MGEVGAAFAINVTYISSFLMQEFYYRVWKRNQLNHLRWPLFSKETIQGWREYLKLGVPCTLTMCFEWWAMEITTVFAGILGAKQLGAQVAIVNFIGTVYMIPLGVQFAASGMVGNEIGRCNIKQAKRYAACCIILAASLNSVFAVFFNIYPRAAGVFFTDDEDVIAIVASIMPILSLYFIVDAICGVQSGNVRALGRQFSASIITLGCHYVLGMPLALLLGFTMQMDVKGFWMGFTVSMTCLCVIISYLVITA